tara:strand:- start:80 stop:676 length:597 start_codon:yes stop_codon:yes gene_type:complete
MIVFIKGKLVEISENFLVIDANGIGYICYITLQSYEKYSGSANNEISISTYYHVTDSSQTLFGFVDQLEKDVFMLLIGVSGIGPKTAIQMLSSIKASELRDRVASGEVDMLTAVPGIGTKTAKRIIIELKEKFNMVSDKFDMPIERESSDPRFKDAYDALITLGYKSTEIKMIINKLVNNDNNMKTAEIIKKVLKDIR